jgi:hypothetical protein
VGSKKNIYEYKPGVLKKVLGGVGIRAPVALCLIVHAMRGSVFGIGVVTRRSCGRVTAVRRTGTVGARYRFRFELQIKCEQQIKRRPLGLPGPVGYAILGKLATILRVIDHVRYLGVVNPYQRLQLKGPAGNDTYDIPS